MFDIINNKRNSVDVDKFDYICRDTKMMDISHGYFDPKILLKEARVIDNQICYPDKYAFEVIKLFQSRYDLYKNYYTHRTVHAVELLLCDVLLESHNILYNFEECIFDMEKYVGLTDYILYEIEFSTDIRLKKAQDLIKRIKRRDFYKFVGEKVVPVGMTYKYNEINETNIVNC